MIENRYSNTYAVNENKNYKFVQNCKIKLYGALKANVDIYIYLKETLETTRSCFLNVKWSHHDFNNAIYESWIQIYDFIPQTEKELQLYLDGYTKGVESGKSNVSDRLFPDDMLNLFNEINTLIDKRNEKAVENFKYEIQNM